MSAWILLALAACGPKIDPGPAAAVLAKEPVTLVTTSDPTSPNLYLQAYVAAGSAYDPTGKEGIASLTARSLAEAGAGERSAEALKDALYLTGADLDVRVDQEWVSLRLRCHRDHATTCVDLFADVLTAPVFTTKEVERLRDEALYAVSQGMLSSEEELGAAVIDAWIFEAHPYGHPIEGRAGVLPLLTASDARVFYDDHYVRESVTIGMAGAWDEPLRAHLVERLSALPGKPAPELALQQPLPVAGRSLLAVGTATPITGFHLGHPLPLLRSDPDWPALYVGVQTFGAHRQQHGRLFNSLREARGLNYGTYAYVEPFVQRGGSTLPEQGVLRRQPFFSIWVRPTSLENGPFALKLAIDELERLVADGLAEEEFEENRGWLLGHLALEARDPGRRMLYALDAQVTGQPNLLETLPAALKAVTLEQVNDALRTHLHPENLRIVAVSGDPADLVKRLTEETPTPIVYNDIAPSPEQSARDEAVAAKDLDLVEARAVPAEGIFR